jgi:hypothetical protein
MRVFLLSFGGLWRVFARLSFIPVFRDTPSAYQIRQYCLAYKISRLLSGSLEHGRFEVPQLREQEGHAVLAHQKIDIRVPGKIV